MATFQADHRNLGRAVHAGLNTVKSAYTFSTTASIGDVIQFARLPTQATVTRVVFYGYLTSTSTLSVKVGTDSSTARFYVSSSQITTLHNATLLGTSLATAGIGYKFSASDDATNQYEYVSATVNTGSGSGSPGDTIAVIYDYVIAN